MVSLRTRQCCSSTLTSEKKNIENWFKWNKSFCQQTKIWILLSHLPLSLPIFGGGSGFWPFEIGRFPPFWAVRLCKCNSTLVLVCFSVTLEVVLVPFSSFLSCEPLLRLPQLQFEVLADPSHHHYPAATAPLKSSKCKLQTQTQKQNRKYNCLKTS